MGKSHVRESQNTASQTATRGASTTGATTRNKEQKEIQQAASGTVLTHSRGNIKYGYIARHTDYSVCSPLRNHVIKKLRQAKVPKWLKKMPNGRGAAEFSK